MVIALAFNVPAQDNPKKILSSATGSARTTEPKAEIRDNGTLTINDVEYAYKVKVANITVVGDDGAAVMPFSLDGDTLTVQFEGARDRVLKGNPPERRKLTGTAAAPGRRRHRSSIRRQMVLYVEPDRLKLIYVEPLLYALRQWYLRILCQSSSSGVLMAVLRQCRFGPLDRHTQQHHGDLEQQRKTGFPIELRNHPKTGDAMIVVGGDAYVTATQRPPW